MNTIPTLDAVQASFQDWRRHKTHHCSRTPDTLKTQAVALLARHSRAEVCRALGITRRMLNTWEDDTGASPENTATPIEFVALPLEPTPAPGSDGSLSLELTQPNGNCWRLQGEPSREQLRAFVTALSGGAR